MGKTHTRHTVAKDNLKNPKPDINNYSTPKVLMEKLDNVLKKVFPNWNTGNVVDLFCDEKNCKFSAGFTQGGSVGINPQLEGDSYQQIWSAFPFGWLASPYGPGDQERTSTRAVEEAKNGMIIPGCYQYNPTSDWWINNIENNPNCDYVMFKKPIHYDDEQSQSPFVSAFVAFGVKKGTFQPYKEEIESIPALYGRRGVIKIGSYFKSLNIQKVNIDGVGEYRVFAKQSYNGTYPQTISRKEKNDFTEEGQKIIRDKWFEANEYRPNSIIKAGEWYTIRVTPEYKVFINGEKYDFRILDYFYINLNTTFKKILMILKSFKIITDITHRKVFIEHEWTNDYDDFYLLNGNRLGSIESANSTYRNTDYNKLYKRVLNICSSIRIMGGYDECSPVIVAIIDDKKLILDGQGRIMACRMMGIEFLYRINYKIKTYEEAKLYVQLKNSTQEKWDLNDFLYANAENAGWFFDKLGKYPYLTPSNLVVTALGQNFHKKEKFIEGVDFSNILPLSDEIVILLDKCHQACPDFREINLNYFVSVVCNLRRDIRWTEDSEKKLLDFLPSLTHKLSGPAAYDKVLRKATGLFEEEIKTIVVDQDNNIKNTLTTFPEAQTI